MKNRNIQTYVTPEMKVVKFEVKECILVISRAPAFCIENIGETHDELEW
jgi:hypothetical protein